ncbi:hypothetical protein C8R34_101294 [Nitrosomonas sp. Nm84]|uniref:hypothetical protein n=1 Tax=Nitrosomonas sp. Nm84 TaxID=200124 RepID=UPI000D76B2BA|nr:hypothetical protein [Nitrosomonas sp. Nm84]PXW91381.1 hypothetical protein C8R34_101294 [Nitrosomonas sp. Nm84]
MRLLIQPPISPHCFDDVHYGSVCDAKQGLEKYFMFYNQNRPYTAFDDKTPNEFYFDNLLAM